MALKGKIYSIAKQYDDLNTNKIFESMMIESTDKNSIVLDGRNIGAGSIFAEQIHANAITADHIKSGAIETDHMDAGTIDVSVLKGSQLILPGINYGGVVINNNGLSMKSTGTAKLDIKLSSVSGFNITDRFNNQLIDINPSTGNVKMQVNEMTIGGYSAATTEDVEGAVQNIEVGGRNLVLDTEMNDTWGRTWGSGAATKTTDGYKVTMTGSVQHAMGDYFTEDIIRGETYTISFKARGNINLMELYVLTASGENVKFHGSSSHQLSTTEFNKYSIVFTYNSANPSEKLFIGGQGASGQWLEVKRNTVMFEKGNKATDWTPAPEDVQAKIDSRPTFGDFDKTDKVTINGGNIKAGTISSEKNYSWIDLDDGTFSFGNGGLVWDGLDMVVNGKISVNNIDGDIPKSKLASNVQAEINAGSTAKTKTDAWTHPGTTLIGGDFIETRTMTADRIKARSITANEIKAKSITTEELSVTSLSAITANLGTVTAGIIRSEDNAINIDLDTGTINLSRPLTINSLPVSTKKEVEDAVQSIEIGGRNLIKKSDFGNIVLSGVSEVTVLDEDYQNGLKATGGNNNKVNHIEFPNVLDGNGWYTLSLLARGTQNGTRALSVIIGDSPPITVGRISNTANEYTYHTYSYKVENYDVETNNSIKIAQLDYAYYRFDNIKLERGNKATDWTPAPEDTDKRLDEVEGNINNAVTTIDNTGVTVKDGSFFLEDDTSDTKYSLQVKRNMIDYHSFETVHAFPPEYNDLTSSTVNPDNTSNTSIGGSWNRVGSPRITRGGATYQNEKVGIFGKSIVANNSNYIFLMLSSSQAELFPGERLTFSFHSKAPILGTGGIPRVEVHMVRANNTVVTTIGTKNYPASTKAIKRHSFSFTIPSNFDDNSHLLRIRVLSSNSNEVVIDGTQLVEGNHPVQYDLATEAWNLREELGMNSQNLRGDINYRGISPGLIHTNQISVPNNSDSRVINFMQSDGISTHMWVDEAVVSRSLDVYGNINISENPIIDSGHNSNGEWMKFYDGTMICRGYRVKTMALNSSWGSMYWGNIGVMTYPKEFVKIPYVTYTSSSESALFVATIANRSRTQTGNVDIYRPVSTASQRWEIGYIAIGRWKW